MLFALAFACFYPMQTECVSNWIPDALAASNSLVRSAFLSLYGLRHLTLQERLVDQFYKGLDEFKMCLSPNADADIDDIIPSTTLTWKEAIKARLVPGYAEELKLRRIAFINARASAASNSKPWAGCVIGSIRAASSGYLIVTDTVRSLIPTALSNSLLAPSSVYNNAARYLKRGALYRRIPYRKAVQRAATFTSNLLPWK